MGLHRIVVPRRRGVGVGGVRGPVIVSVFGEDRSVLVRGSFSLAGEFGLFACVMFMVRYVLFSRSLWILY